MKIAVTGATGYIGRRLIRAARLAGYEILALSRSPVLESGVAWQPFTLADVGPLSLPLDVSAVFHLAAETSEVHGSHIMESQAAERLIKASESIGARFVFISSQTAQQNAPTGYGRIKWQIERTTLSAGGLVVRPGLVYGGPERGLFGQLCAIVRRWPAVPVFLPAPIVQPIHVDDLAEALLACLKVEPSTVLCVATPGGIRFSEFLQAIAIGRTGRHPTGIPVPSILISFLSKLLGSRLSGKFGLDRLRSLFALRLMDTSDVFKQLSISPRPLCAGVTRSGCGRRELIREGAAMLSYILRMQPAYELVRRYVRIMEVLRHGQGFRLPELVKRMPLLLTILDDPGCADIEFRRELGWRLNATLLLAEASPQGSARFLGLSNRSSWLRNACRIAFAMIAELVRRICQLILCPIISRALRGRASE